MKNLAIDAWAFLCAIAKNWKAATSAIVGIVGWVAGALSPMPLSSEATHWILIGGGTFAMLIACFIAWRQERGIKDARKAYLQLTQIAKDGERRLATFDTRGHDTKLALTGIGDLQAWHKNTLAILEKEYRAHWGYFADIGKFGSGGPESQTMAFRSRAAAVEVREEVAILVERVYDLRDSLKLPKP